MLLLSLSVLSAADKVFERTYIATDKAVYVAGDRIWCSAFCFDLSTGKLSENSRIAYVQLVSSQGVSLTSKINLESGRGAGYIDIPFSQETGNYRLVAFTAENKNEIGYDFQTNSKSVTIFNTVSAVKIPSGVKVLEADKFPHLENMKTPGSGKLALSAATVHQGDSLSINVTNLGKAATFSISVSHEDGLDQVQPMWMDSFQKGSAAGKSYERKVLSEYEGEVIYADVAGPEKDKVETNPDLISGYISTIGTPNDIFVGEIDKATGTMVFRTSNIYGNKDIVCEVDEQDGDIDAHIELRSPFVSMQPSDIPQLNISTSMMDVLAQRGRAMSQRKANLDESKFEFLSRREDMLLTSGIVKVYKSEDYTRFPTIREVLTEYVSEARVRGRKNNLRIEVLVADAMNRVSNNWKASLVMFNGVPVFKHEKMLEYDAMLVKEIKIWPCPYIFGSKVYDGAINFVTELSDAAYMNFGSNVRIMDFVGAAYPMQHTKPYVSKAEKDLRETILWQPLLTIEEGKTQTLKCIAPDYSGTFRIVVEGVDENGAAFAESCTVKVD